MSYLGTYERLGLTVYASRRQVINAALRKLKKRARFDRGARLARHAYLREILAHHEAALSLVKRWRL